MAGSAFMSRPATRRLEHLLRTLVRSPYRISSLITSSMYKISKFCLGTEFSISLENRILCVLLMLASELFINSASFYGPCTFFSGASSFL